MDIIGSCKDCGSTVGQCICNAEKEIKQIAEQFKKDNMKGQYLIIDLRNMDFMKDENGKINYYDTEEEAVLECGMYEFENAWVMRLMYNHIEI